MFTYKSNCDCNENNHIEKYSNNLQQVNDDKNLDHFDDKYNMLKRYKQPSYRDINLFELKRNLVESVLFPELAKGSKCKYNLIFILNSSCSFSNPYILFSTKIFIHFITQFQWFIILSNCFRSILR